MYPIRFGEVRERLYTSNYPIHYAAVGQRESDTLMHLATFDGKEAETLSRIEALYRTPIGAIKDFDRTSSRSQFVYKLSNILGTTGVFQTPIQPFLVSFPNKEQMVQEIESGLKHHDYYSSNGPSIPPEDKLTLEDAMRAFMVNPKIDASVFLNLLMSSVISNLTKGLQVHFPLMRNFCSFVSASSPATPKFPEGTSTTIDNFFDQNSEMDTGYKC